MMSWVSVPKTWDKMGVHAWMHLLCHRYVIDNMFKQNALQHSPNKPDGYACLKKVSHQRVLSMCFSSSDDHPSPAAADETASLKKRPLGSWGAAGGWRPETGEPPLAAAAVVCVYRLRSAESIGPCFCSRHHLMHAFVLGIEPTKKEGSIFFLF